MRILVCNDDGIDAPGVHRLAEAAKVLGPDIWVVAPERKWTAAGHQLSFDRDLTLTRRGEQMFACSGAPADCVVAAMTVLFVDGPKPDLVLAGVNDKRNVAEDLAYSGTMAIAREGTFWDVPAISVSQANGVTDGPALLATLQRLLPKLWQSRREWSGDGHWLGVNLPAVLPAPITQARVGRDKIAAACDVLERTPERITYRIRRGRPETREPADENCLIDAGRIAVVRHCWFADAPLP
ncbi:MAG: 5'/3'-nucleotidase SurE, partial [Betaproteobacteria bacterium]